MRGKEKWIEERRRGGEGGKEEKKRRREKGEEGEMGRGGEGPTSRTLWSRSKVWSGLETTIWTGRGATEDDTSLYEDMLAVALSVESAWEIESSEMDACIQLVGLHSAGQQTGKNYMIQLSSILCSKSFIDGFGLAVKL